MALLELRNVNRRFGGLHAVNQVSFDVSKGQIKAVIGPNGAGKTTLFNLIAGTLPLSSGSVRFKGSTISGEKPHQIAGLGICRTFQNIKLFHGMSVLENVMVGCHLRSRSGFVSGMLSPPWSRREEKWIRQEALDLLEELHIADLAHLEADSLAFGQQRAVEFARALAARPELLLLDEPAAGLNIYETDEVGAFIGRIRDQGITVLLVEHDMSLVMDISDEVLVLSFGEKIAEGTPREIQDDQEVVRVYLGEEERA